MTPKYRRSVASAFHVRRLLPPEQCAARSWCSLYREAQTVQSAATKSRGDCRQRTEAWIGPALLSVPRAPASGSLR